MAINVKLKKRLQRKNVKGRAASYWPRAVAAHKNLEVGTTVFCLEDAIGDKPKMVRVIRHRDHFNYTQNKQVDTFVVLLEDLTE